MKVLIFGGNGQLGKELRTFIPEAISYSHSTIGVEQTADVRSAVLVDKTISNNRPDVIINAAAMTNVDKCEEDKISALAVNGYAVNSMVKSARSIGAFFVQVSTDYVFDGIEGNYTEDSLPNPINYYGFSKIIGDIYASSYENSLIVRTSGVFGHINNFPKFAFETLKSNKELKVIDGFYSPIHARMLARSIAELILSRPTGFLNIAGEKTSRMTMAKKIAQMYGFDEKLIKESELNLTLKAKRPYDSSLVIEKAKRIISFNFYSQEDGLRLMGASHSI